MEVTGLVLAVVGALLAIGAGVVQWRSAPGPEGPTAADMLQVRDTTRRVAGLAVAAGVLTLAGVLLAALG